MWLSSVNYWHEPRDIKILYISYNEHNIGGLPILQSQKNLFLVVPYSFMDEVVIVTMFSSRR